MNPLIKSYYSHKYTKKCLSCNFPMSANDPDLCDECNDKELAKQDAENEARHDYIANGGRPEDF